MSKSIQEDLDNPLSWKKLNNQKFSFPFLFPTKRKFTGKFYHAFTGIDYSLCYISYVRKFKKKKNALSNSLYETDSKTGLGQCQKIFKGKIHLLNTDETILNTMNQIL